MGGLASALDAFWALVSQIFDPFCGSAGIFTWFASGTLLACGDAGWGDEIGFGFKVTVTLAAATLPFGLLIGFLMALATQSSERMLRQAAAIYTTIFRGLPELLTLFIVYYGSQILIQAVLASMGFEERIEINAFFAGMIALALVFSSYCAEVLQSAFRAIPSGQYEAGFAIGLSRTKTMLLVIVPQLIRIALPGIVNLWMNLLKDTALVSVIGLSDIIRQTGIAARVTKEAFLFYTIACALYLVLAILSSIAVGYIENWTKQSGANR
ncbi:MULTISPECIES: ABC transporter permease [Rhizobium/Agrobacterium group]|uniref:ABC transporter membrane spanning protein (Amino acid) n=2 Tax=Rhizobium/Agrobacterium group TaxID=227290 RepID=B9JW44_ALLAM|nr:MULTISPECIES: ABC transporter permease [Rhizobium/Agrobacterium group]ACM36472.1 ABC transporter membrane spanning protein (amino acid) [Allorhizobium ampelinum S4]MCF1435346.1 ABC transporter permease [Allorhizobium ampelinum]MCF1448643.1 ABC transporter permease [Allorhizobium ampelinum]MCF1494670.1 ABC transporter permease [Allorhizobium ampelinum]MUO27630.1 ABC transporter permease subunit [Agrobacterium vitis]